MTTLLLLTALVRDVKPTEAATLRALRWLARHQSEDGARRMIDHTQRCGRAAELPGKCEAHGINRSIDVKRQG